MMQQRADDIQNTRRGKRPSALGAVFSRRFRQGLCAALALALAGCAALPSGMGAQASSAAPSAGAAPPATAESAAPQTLAVWYQQENAAAARALSLYAAANNVTVTTAEDAASAGLGVLTGEPADTAAWRDLSAAGDPLLAAAARRAGLDPSGALYTLPLGKTLYAYWADGSLLTALLGQDFAVSDLQNATWDEWEAFVAALSGWIAAPAAKTVTLNGNRYTLPAEKPDAAARLNGVFALATGADAFTGAAYSAALVAADATMTDEALSGPLYGLLNAFSLETAALSGPDGALARGGALPALSAADAAALLGDGKAVFYRGRLTDATLHLSPDFCQKLVPVPQKTKLAEEDLTTAEYNVTGLLNYPVLVTAGRLAIPAAADAAAAGAGASFILWLYGSGGGSAALTDAVGLITPWNTASDQTALGAMQVAQVSAGVIPGAELSDAALQGTADAAQTLLGLADWKTADRAAFVAAAEQALGVPAGG